MEATLERSELAVMGLDGDSKLMWDNDIPAEVDAARAMFDALKAKGYAAYAVKKNGDKGEVIRSFDPQAEKIIMAPQTVGG